MRGPMHARVVGRSRWWRLRRCLAVAYMVVNRYSTVLALVLT